MLVGRNVGRSYMAVPSLMKPVGTRPGREKKKNNKK
jgi:hypothetical protein